jgi:two-component system nitrate/nitrite response regulator NarL
MDPRINVVGEASDDCEMVKMAKRLRPDVVLLDLDMRCCDSFEAVSEISKRRLANSIVALTIHDEASERKAAERAGVDLFLEKGISSKQLIEAVRRTTPEGVVAQG